MLSRRRFIKGVGAAVALLSLHLGNPEPRRVTVWKASQPGPSGSDPIPAMRAAMLAAYKQERTAEDFLAPFMRGER